MARATFVKKARKTIKGTGIKKGDSYYWWKFRFGSKHVSKTPPRRSQLTQSAFYSTMYDAEDTAADIAEQLRTGKIDFADAKDQLEQIKGDVESAGDECQGAFDNMPEGLQQGDTGQLLERRVEVCQDISSEIDNIDIPDDDDEDLKNDDAREAKREEIANEIDGISWDIE
jgi:hypothetical protein